MKKIIITEAYEYYWKFATERQSIFYNRYENKAKITNNPILKKYKFTNAYRASDRVSQYLIKEVIYKNNNYSLDDILFRILLFKIFNKIETWEYLIKRLGDIRFESFNYKYYDQLLNERMAKGNTIYSSAYMMPSATKFKQQKKHSNHLLLLEYIMKDNFFIIFLNTNS